MAVFLDKFHRLQFASITWSDNLNKFCFRRTKCFGQESKESVYWIRILLRNFEATFTSRYTFQAAFYRIVTPRAHIFIIIDPFHKWLPIINSFVSIKISLTNLVFELIIQKNFYAQTSLVRLI